jgi:hypothetical protein
LTDPPPLLIGRRFETKALAVQWVELERASMATR